MNRNPWRSRTWLTGLFDAVAGGVLGVIVYLGLTDGVGVVESIIGLFNVGLAVAVHLGVIESGEAQTTPVDDPLGRDGLPLLPFRRMEELSEAVDAEDLERVRALLGREVTH